MLFGSSLLFHHFQVRVNKSHERFFLYKTITFRSVSGVWRQDLQYLLHTFHQAQTRVSSAYLSCNAFWFTISPCLLYLVRGCSQIHGVSKAGVGGVRAWWVGRSCFKSPRFGLRLCQASPASASVVISSSLYQDSNIFHTTQIFSERGYNNFGLVTRQLLTRSGLNKSLGYSRPATSSVAGCLCPGEDVTCALESSTSPASPLSPPPAPLPDPPHTAGPPRVAIIKYTGY